MMSPNEGRERGEKRGERGIRRAAFKHEPQIRRDMLRFLDCLLLSPTSCATLDAATGELAGKHPDGGRWRGSIPKRLKAAGLIVSGPYVTSCRPSRHAGPITEWRLVNRPAAEAMRATLAAQLEKEAGESAGTESPAVNSTINPQPQGNEDHGQTV